MAFNAAAGTRNRSSLSKIRDESKTCKLASTVLLAFAKCVAAGRNVDMSLVSELSVSLRFKWEELDEEFTKSFAAGPVQWIHVLSEMRYPAGLKAWQLNLVSRRYEDTAAFQLPLATVDEMKSCISLPANSNDATQALLAVSETVGSAHESKMIQWYSFLDTAQRAHIAYKLAMQDPDIQQASTHESPLLFEANLVPQIIIAYCNCKSCRGTADPYVEI